MTQFVVYRKPAVKDKYYDEHDWTQDNAPFDSRDEARNYVPAIGSPVGEGYNFKIAKFDEEEDVPITLTDREIRKRT